MNDRYPPYDRCLSHPLWPASDSRAPGQTLPTGTPDQGCPIGVRSPATDEWEPVRKRQADHSYQVVQDISGHAMPYMEEWGSLEVGDPNRRGIYRLMIPDPLGDGTFRDGEGGRVRGWNGSILVSIYPGMEASSQTVPAHLLGRVPQWDEHTVDRSVVVDELGNLVRTPDTFEGFHWLRRGYAVVYALPPRGYLLLLTESAERTVMAAVRKLDEAYPFASVPVNAKKHARRHRFLTGSSAGGPPVLALMESTGQSELFDGGYSSGPVSATVNYFAAFDALWVSRALEALRSTLGERRTTAAACAALLGYRSHGAGLGDQLLVPDPDRGATKIMDHVDSVSP